MVKRKNLLIIFFLFLSMIVLTILIFDNHFVSTEKYNHVYTLENTDLEKKNELILRFLDEYFVGLGEIDYFFYAKKKKYQTFKIKIAVDELEALALENHLKTNFKIENQLFYSKVLKSGPVYVKWNKDEKVIQASYQGKY